MPKELYEAATLAEFIQLLKTEQGDSNRSLGAKIGVSGSTIHRLLRGVAAADDETLDKIADYAGVSRDWLYKLAKGIPSRPKYSRTVSMLIALLEQAPPDIQEIMLVQARALIENRKKKSAKNDEPGDALAGG